MCRISSQNLDPAIMFRPPHKALLMVDITRKLDVEIRCALIRAPISSLSK